MDRNLTQDPPQNSTPLERSTRSASKAIAANRKHRRPRRHGRAIRGLIVLGGVIASLTTPALLSMGQSPQDRSGRQRLRQRYILRQDPPANVPKPVSAAPQTGQIASQASDKKSQSGDKKLTD
ncbi:MAG: hypothetical protein ACK5OB_08610, partial [Pirellula sp.]